MAARATAALAALLIAAAFLTAEIPAALAASAAASPQQAARLDANGRKILGEVDKLLNEETTNSRKRRRNACVSGQAAQLVLDEKAHGAGFIDAADMCVFTLEGLAGAGHLGDLYRDLLTELGGDVVQYEEWPRSIGAVATGNATELSIGNKKVIDLTSALAFDAGFTVAYQDGDAAKAPSVDSSQLKTLAQACVGPQGKPGPCFAAGYVYGAHAFTNRRLPSP